MAEFVDELFGQWHAQADAATKSLESAAPALPDIWRFDVSPDTQQAHRQLALQRAQLARDQRGLEHAVQRLTVFTDAWSPGQSAAAKSLDLETSPETALTTTLAQIGQPQEKGVFDPLEAARAEFERFVRRVRELITNYAEVETAVAGRATGRTVVGWTGDFKSVWGDDVSVEQIALHRQNVHLALARRAMLMKLLIVVSTGAAKIIARLATPGAQLLVVPAVWQFVKDVIVQVQALNAAPS